MLYYKTSVRNSRYIQILGYVVSHNSWIKCLGEYHILQQFSYLPRQSGISNDQTKQDFIKYIIYIICSLPGGYLSGYLHWYIVCCNPRDVWQFSVKDISHLEDVCMNSHLELTKSNTNHCTLDFQTIPEHFYGCNIFRCDFFPINEDLLSLCLAGKLYLNGWHWRMVNFIAVVEIRKPNIGKSVLLCGVWWSDIWSRWCLKRIFA